MKDVISAISSGPSARGLPVQVRPAPWVLSSWPRPRPCARRPGAAPTEPGRRRLCMPCEAAEGHEARGLGGTSTALRLSESGHFPLLPIRKRSESARICLKNRERMALSSRHKRNATVEVPWRSIESKRASVEAQDSSN